MKDKALSFEQVLELLSFLAAKYVDDIDSTSEEDLMAASAYGRIAFDLTNIVLMMQGNFDEVEEIQKTVGPLGSFSLARVNPDEEDMAANQGRDKAEWPPINAPGDDPGDQDPSKWN